jgi:hypothetical protein
MGKALRMLTVLGALVVALGCGDSDAPAVEPVEPDGPELREIMGVFFENLRVVLPRTVGPAGLRADDPGGEIRAALVGLEENAEVLEDHTRLASGNMRHLARSLQRDTAEILAEYDRGNTDRAGYLIRQVTENCVVCHSRLPSPGDSPLAEDFLDYPSLAELAPYERATLQIATRRFDDALATLEEAITSEAEHPALLLGPLTDYLTISIRVKDDYERPVPVLKRFVQRPDVWTRMRLDVEAWIAALPELRRRTRGEPDLATARAILAEGTAFGSVNDPREGLVHMIAASAVLQRAIESGRLEGEALAEAYYLLGITEARIGRNYWLTQAPHFLEVAIRLAPHAPFARDAYALLEEEILMLYEGTDWERIPEEDAGRLAELRALMGDAD